MLEGGVDSVLALDASPQMIETTCSADGRIQGIVGDAERLPLASGSVDVVTCRLAAHHFPAPEQFIAEVARVLEANGLFVFEDTVGPDDAEVREFLEHIETVRDPTHVASQPVDQWREWIDAAGLRVEQCQRFAKRIPFEAWMAAQSVPTDRRETIESALQSATPLETETLGIERSAEGVEAISLPKVLLGTRR
ncbi:MAG: class I SAM-dependent methyltransferase [Natrialbaceae archaeon]|nr:class I SAM-dependent methyltransferase [Natrialbaceae archaeon]